jgi:type II secretory pathway component GspD/PulD (secretin)
VEASKDLPPLVREPWGLGPVTLSAVDAPASFVLLEAATQANVSITVPDTDAEVLLTVDYRDTPAQVVFEQVGDRLGLAPSYADGSVSFATTGTARALAVYRQGHHEPEEVVQAVQAVLGQDAEVVSIGSRVLVAGTGAQVAMSTDLAKYLEAGPDGWRLDVRVVSITDTFRRDLGLDWEIGATAELAMGGSSGDLAQVLTGSSASLVVQAVASATESTSNAALLHSATLYVLEDGTATMNQGDRLPIPRYQTSPEGTTTVIGYEFIDTGFQLTASAVRVPGGVRLQLEPAVSTVTGFVVDAPIVTESRVTAQAVVSSGEWLIISGLSTQKADDGESGLPGLRAIGRREQNGLDASIVYLVRAERIYAAEGTR